MLKTIQEPSHKQITPRNTGNLMRIAVIADDLTGALDTGVQFRQWGYSVQLTDNPEQCEAEVAIVNTDTRNKTPKEAYSETYRVAKGLSHDIIYKKTDSTLRGYPGQEIQAILDATGETKAILSPSYPTSGRRVKDGHLYVRGRPITETEYINEYRRKTSNIAEILETETPVYSVTDPSELAETGITVVDSETEHDLLKIAEHHTRIMAGSAGLADALCQVLRAPAPVLTVIGSMRSETRAQVELLKKRLGAAVIPLDAIGALSDGSQSRAINDASKALNSGQDLVITSTPTDELIEATRNEASRLGLSPFELENRITYALASVTEQLLKYSLSGLIITGGATALAITRQLGTKSIEILDEVQPGVPVLRLDQIKAVTKAGGFGQVDTLIQATKYLKRGYR